MHLTSFSTINDHTFKYQGQILNPSIVAQAAKEDFKCGRFY